jgi:hypothetical protein
MARAGQATWQKVCKIVAALPGTELDPPGGHHAPAWRVHGKVIVRLNPRLRVPGEEAILTEAWRARAPKGSCAK